MCAWEVAEKAESIVQELYLKVLMEIRKTRI